MATRLLAAPPALAADAARFLMRGTGVGAAVARKRAIRPAKIPRRRAAVPKVIPAKQLWKRRKKSWVSACAARPPRSPQSRPLMAVQRVNS